MTSALNSRVPVVEESQDLGFGAVVAGQSKRRLLNRDGSFNVVRRGLGTWSSLSVYHALITMSWRRFFGVVGLVYVMLNAIFAAAYFAFGPGTLQGPTQPAGWDRFAQAYFFSVQTLATIGYGHISPAGVAANILVTFESLVGLLSFALATGLVFARFSRPTAQILFSRSAIIAPYRAMTAFEFRIANARHSQIIELEAKVLYSRLQLVGEERKRAFEYLTLERSKVTFFPLTWTVVHPIDDSSPLRGVTAESLRESSAEFLILLTGIDETFSQQVHARSSYKADEVVWNAKFADLFNRESDDALLSIDIGRLDEVEVR
ncbi:MAG: ion transporter [Anaerolineae bacterium]|nr:ion transporter [Gemmatimonadaceae bacterium]